MIGMVREVALAAFAVVGLAAPPSVASVGALAVTAALGVHLGERCPFTFRGGLLPIDGEVVCEAGGERTGVRHAAAQAREARPTHWVHTQPRELKSSGGVLELLGEAHAVAIG